MCRKEFEVEVAVYKGEKDYKKIYNEQKINKNVSLCVVG